MARTFSTSLTPIVTIEGKNTNPIKVAGEYMFRVRIIKATDSRHSLNGDSRPENELPDFIDATPQIAFILENVQSSSDSQDRETFFYSQAIQGYLKMKDLSDADKAAIKKQFGGIKPSERDGYALVPSKTVKGAFIRLTAQEGDSEYEGVRTIVSNLMAALGFNPDLTLNPADKEELNETIETILNELEQAENEGTPRYFKGTLVNKAYLTRDMKDSERLEMNTKSFKKITDKDMEIIEALNGQVENFR